MVRFAASLYQVGINRCVDVPPRVSETLGTGACVYVAGRMEGISFRSTLMPRAGGGHRLFVHGRIWRPLGLRSGSRITVEFDRDPSGGEVPLPPFWVEALARRPRAARRFATLPPATKREIVRWLTAARQGATRERRIEVVLDRLEAGRLRDRS